ncbi:MAG: efflux RND transporter permease subunit [Treponema sp.]|nr:efflux RND transporter permease subunit [Treponema sp.]
MKSLINLFICRPVTVIMILCALTLAAVFSIFTLPINRLPDFTLPRVTVETVYPGMAANEIRSLVTIPLEDGLSPIKGLERMKSISRDNRCLISLDFRWGTDPMAASVLVREAVDAVYPSLPEGVKKPMVTSGDNGAEAHAIIAVSSHNGNNEFARKLAEYEIQARLRRIDGVGSVIIVGGDINEEKISLDVHRLAALGLNPSDFSGLLAQETADIPAGNAREENMELVIVSSGRPDSIYSFSQIILPVGSGGLKVDDAGKIFSSPARRESIFVYDGKEAVGLEIYRRPGADPLRLSKEIKKTVDEAVLLFSRDAKIELVIDSSYSLINSLTGLLISAVLAAAAVITVLFLFIRRLKYSLFVALSIPVSIAAGICILSVTGKSLNGMSLSGLAIGIGLVSDISVIVLDLLNRSFDKNDLTPLPREVGEKVSSIAGSSVASTLTTALVFMPIIMLPGPLGSLFGDIAIALVASVTAGWFYAQFCLPSLFLLFFNSKGKIFNKNPVKDKSMVFIGNLVKKYSCFLSSILRQKKPGWHFIFAIVISIFGFLTLLTRPMVFINPDDAEEVWVSVIFPPGSLLESFSDFSVNTSKLLSDLTVIKTVYGRAGAREEDINRRADIDYRKEEIIIRCVIKKGIKPEKALAEIKKVLNQNLDMPFSAYFPKDRAEVLLGLSAKRTYVIKGKDRNELLERFEIAKETFNTASVAVHFRPRGRRSELRLYPDREASAYLSVPAAQIAETLFILNEGIVVTKLENEGKLLDVRVTGDQGLQSDRIRQLEQIPIRTGQGKTVFLGSLVNIKREDAEASLARLDRSDVIYADIAASKEIPAAVNKLASRFSWFSGADESVFNRYKNSLFVYVFLVLILLYMAIGAQFESFLLPLILMMNIPFSLAGAGPALLITVAKIDSGAILGLTALFGLVVNNSLLLFEISEQKIKIGLSPATAVFCGSRERFKAILITMVTTIFALLPLIFSPLGNSQKSMAAAMLGGLTISTIISLYVIPPVLVRFFKWRIK